MADNRTERATPRRRQQAREKGQVLRNRELVSALTLMAVILFLAWQPALWIGRWQNYFSHALGASLGKDWTEAVPVLSWTMLTVARWIAPIFVLAFCLSVGAMLSQGGIVIAAGALAPDVSRLNPANNFRQMVSFSGLSRVLKSLIPTAIILYLALRIAISRAPEVLHSSSLHAHASLALLGSLWFSIAWQSSLVLLAWSGVDYLLQRQTFERSLRMTKQEVRQENKENDGNPQIKGRIRRLRRELLRRSLRKDMQRATAVVTNPTHYAVALEYRPATMAAPLVVAKGRHLVALKIRELARWYEVPIVEDPPLAQALYKTADVGQMIPPKLYAAVAEILAFLYRAHTRMKGSTQGKASE